MADKASGKKDDQKSKKGKQQEKKKGQENGVKHRNKQPVIVSNDVSKKKKNKGNKNHVNSVNSNKSSKKKTASNDKSLIRTFLARTMYVSLFLGFIYLVDYDKFVRIRDTASYYTNKTLSLLPPAVVAKGQETIEFVRPAAEMTYSGVSILLEETSTFFNANPLIKDHWANIREIGSVCSGRLVDYMRTLYLQTTGYCNDVKNKLFQ